MRVIAEAYGREPLDREMVDHQNGLCYLVASDATEHGEPDNVRGVGFPEQYVFAFDQNLFAALRSSFESGDSARLAELWVKANSVLEHV